MIVQPANLTEVDEIVDVVRVAKALDPQWNCRFRYIKEHDDDKLKHTKMLFHNFVDPANDDWLVMVVKAPDSYKESAAKIVAFAVWDVSYRNKSKFGSSYEP